MNSTFNTHEKNQEKMRSGMELVLTGVLNEIHVENKQKTYEFEEMMRIILKKFEIVKYSIN